MILGRTGMACWNGARIVLVDEWLKKGVNVFGMYVDLYIYECAQNTALLSKLLDRFSLDSTYHNAPAHYQQVCGY